jgi:hypothetical protein
MKLLSIVSKLIVEATQYVRKIQKNGRVIKVYTQEHQEENVLSSLDSPKFNDTIQMIFDKNIRRRIPTKIIAKSINDNFDKIWENADGLLKGGCLHKKCRLFFIEKNHGIGQIEYIIQFYENSSPNLPTINAVIITSALSKEGDDYLKSLKNPTPKVRLGESDMCEMGIVYL